MGFSGILFDFNGTMVMDSEVNRNAWAALALEAWGLRLTEETLTRVTLGNSNLAIITEFAGKTLPERDSAALSERKEEIYRKLSRRARLKLADGLAALLDELKKRGYPLNIATASIWSNIEFYFSHYELYRWFDIKNVAYDDGETLPKPHPDMYIKAAAAIHASPSDCLIFEDSDTGLEAAARAGAKRIVAVRKAEGSIKLPQVRQVIPDFRAFDRGLLGLSSQSG
ncbi:MAG TPA: HAD family phosphatase [Feifaniaceae bacterium]|nr:HAD family phosphatase [Feifaniaceae bacterium]